MKNIICNECGEIFDVTNDSHDGFCEDCESKEMDERRLAGQEAYAKWFEQTYPNEDMYMSYDVDESPHAIAIEGKCQFHMPKNNFYGFGDLDGNDYHSQVLENPTWLEIAMLATECRDITKDWSHCYFEGIRETPPTDEDRKNMVPPYVFLMGS